MQRRLASLATMILLAGAPACLDTDDLGDDAELVEGVDDNKADQADIELTVLDVGRPIVADDRKVGVIKSKTAYKAVFGENPPASIDFSRDWVVYYTAGVQTSGGYTASITRVRLSDTGKTLKITAHLESPGATCIVTAALSQPYAVVKLKKPTSPQPTTNRYYHEETVTDCEGASCAASGGAVHTVPRYVSIGANDPRAACGLDEEHCITTQWGACPMVLRPPPSFCANGTIETTPRFIASADGLECELSTYHCVTNAPENCPQWGAPPPCPTGSMLQTTPNYVPSADGMECRMPDLHCVVTDTLQCPAE